MSLKPMEWNLLNLMLVNTGIFAILLFVMLFFLFIKPSHKHGTIKVREDLHKIKEQISGSEDN